MRSQCCLALMVLFGALAFAADADLIPKDAKLEKVTSGCKFSEGPSGDADGNLFFTDEPNNRIMVVRADGKVEVWALKSSASWP